MGSPLQVVASVVLIESSAPFSIRDLREGVSIGR